MTADREKRPASGVSSSSTVERFHLRGPSSCLDQRDHAYRRDLADIALADRVFAPHYAAPLIRACGAIATFLRSEPADSAPHISELLPGEEFAVLDYAGGWAWGYGRHDHYVGYVEAVDLVAPGAAMHIVCEGSAPIHAGDALGAPVLARLPMGARVAGTVQGGCLVTDIGCIPLSYMRLLDAPEDDPVAVAQRLFGMPYLMGGRTWHGIDCSGLVQLALMLCGVPAPRDSDQQQGLGEALPEDAAARRGDLVFYPGHVGMMFDDLMLIHASRTMEKVTLEPVALVAQRSVHFTGKGVIARRRLGV